MKALFLLCAAMTLSAKSPPERHHQVPGVFSSRTDARWTGRSDWAGRYPAYIIMRASAGRTPIMLVEGFQFGNRLYKDPPEFLKKMKVVWKGSRLVAGRKRILWERSFTEPLEMRKDGGGGDHKVRERLVVIERKEDFLVVRLKADETVFEDLSKNFDAFLAAFALLPSK